MKIGMNLYCFELGHEWLITKKPPNYANYHFGPLKGAFGNFQTNENCPQLSSLLRFRRHKRVTLGRSNRVPKLVPYRFGNIKGQTATIEWSVVAVWKWWRQL